MARLTKRERDRLIRALRSAGEHELAAKIHGAADASYTCDDGLRIRSLRLHMLDEALVWGEREVAVDPTVAQLLCVLASVHGTPLTRTELADLLDVRPVRVPVLITRARKAFAAVKVPANEAIRHDPKDDIYWLAADWPLMVAA